MTMTYNPAPTAAQWDNGSSGSIMGLPDGATATPSTVKLFGGVDTPITTPPDIRVPGNDTGVGWYAGALAASPFDRSVLFIGGLGQPYSVGPFLTSASTNTIPPPTAAGTGTVSNTVFFPANSTAGADSDIGKLPNAPHVNYHSATFDSLGRLLVATDGGIWRFTPNNSNLQDAARGGTWENLNGNFLQVTEFNGLDVHPFQPFIMAGGTVGNGTIVSNGSSWSMTSGGNGGLVRIDNRNPNIIYTMSDNFLRRSTDGGRTWTDIFHVQYSTVFQLDLSDPNRPVYTYGLGLPYQFNEPNPFPYMLSQTTLDDAVGAEYATPFPRSYFTDNYPFVLDPNNPSRLFVVQRNPVPTNNDINVLQVALNAEQAAAAGVAPTFVTISDPNVFDVGHITAIGLANLEGNPTRFDGTPVTDPDFANTQQVNGPDSYDPGTIYVLMDNKLLVTKNGGNLWVDRTAGLPGSTTPGAPALNDFGSITVDPNNRNRAYLTRHAFDGEQVWRTQDAGQTWEDITGNLPDLPVWNLTVNPRNGDLYVGNDNGVFRLSGADNAAGNFGHWARLGVGLPSVQVKQLVFNQTTNTLTAGAFGRGVFQMVLDDTAADFAASPGQIGSVRAASGSTVWTGNIVMPGPTEFRAAPGAQVNILGTITELPVGPVVDPRFPTERFFKVTKTGAGRVIFSGPNNFSGTIDVQQGVLTVRNPNALGKLAKVVNIGGQPTLVGQTIVENGAALEMQSNLLGELVQLHGDGIPFNGANTGALRNVSNFNTFTGTLELDSNSTIGVDSGSVLTIGVTPGLPYIGKIVQAGGTFGFTKELTGTLILNTANSYGGATIVKAGILSVQNAAALGSTAGGTAGGTQVLTGAQLQLPGTLSITGEELSLSGTGIFDTGALLVVGTASNRWNALIHLVGPGQAGIGVQGGVFTLPLAIDGNGGLRKVNVGKLTLLTDNTYTGLTTVAGGTLEIRTSGALGASGTAANATELDSGGTLLLNPGTVGVPGASLNIVGEVLNLFGGTLFSNTGDNTWAGNVVLSGTSSAIFVNSDPRSGKSLTLSGVISDVGSPAGFTKRGAGILILTGTNTYRGSTVVEQGVLEVDGTVGNVVLAGGTAGATLWGTGTVGAITSGAGTNTINPGTNVTTGILTSGPATWSATTFFQVLLNDTTPGTGYDQLVVNGDINLNNAHLIGAVGPSVSVGDTFTIISTTGAGRVRGTFAGLADGGTLVLSGERFRVNYTLSAVTLTRIS
jgi:autotransporter-associated beta strand protein